jgi:hypothetical protein
MAIATARFNSTTGEVSTTGEGFTRSSTSYNPQICAQSVAAASAASGWMAAMAA